MAKLLIITDVWNNVSGVVTVLKQIKQELEKQDFVVTIVEPSKFVSFGLPTYPEIKLALALPQQIEKIVEQEQPDYIHIATEGTLGIAARLACLQNHWHFSTYYHTDLPKYVQIRLKSFKETTYNYLRWFHNASNMTMVSTKSLQEDLTAKKFKHVEFVPFGVDTDLFQKNVNAPKVANLTSPIFVFVGRLAPEKNIEAFLDCHLPGSKLVIGAGPSKKSLEAKYKNKAMFVGYKKGQDLVNLLSISDVLVFPSKTETFGIVALEALSCGLPVAGFDSQGLRDIITSGLDGFLGPNLKENALKCLELDTAACRQTALRYSMHEAMKNFALKLPAIK